MEAKLLRLIELHDTTGCERQSKFAETKSQYPITQDDMNTMKTSLYQLADQVNQMDAENKRQLNDPLPVLVQKAQKLLEVNQIEGGSQLDSLKSLASKLTDKCQGKSHFYHELLSKVTESQVLEMLKLNRMTEDERDLAQLD